MCSLIIPVYKSTLSLESIAEQVSELEKKVTYQFELIFVNDSPDFPETVKTLSRLTNTYKNVSVISLRKNQGQHMALLIGLSKATGRYLITMDDDLQHPVDEIPKLVSAIQENEKLDILFAVPKPNQKNQRFWRNAGSYLAHKINTLFLGNPKQIRTSAFRIMRREIRDVIVKNYNAMPSVSSLLMHATNKAGNIEVEHKPRAYGESHYTLYKLISLSLNNIIHYTAGPLKALGAIGFLGFLFSIGLIISTLMRRIFWDISFPGYASTVILISFFGGLNLLAVGIIGEYLIRIIKEQQKWSLDDHIASIHQTEKEFH